MLIDEKAMDALAEAIAVKTARAQLTAADDIVNEATANWSDTVKKTYRVPAIGETRKDGRPITSAERYEAFRAVRSGAEAMLERERVADEKAKAEFEERKQQRMKAEAETIEANKLQNKATLAQWEAQVAAAKARGFNPPAQPTNLLPETPDELAMVQHRALYKNF